MNIWFDVDGFIGFSRLGEFIMVKLMMRMLQKGYCKDKGRRQLRLNKDDWDLREGIKEGNFALIGWYHDNYEFSVNNHLSLIIINWILLCKKWRYKHELNMEPPWVWLWLRTISVTESSQLVRYSRLTRKILEINSV